MNNLLVLDILNCNYIKSNYQEEFKHLDITQDTILTGNIIFKIFNFDLKIDCEDYEIYSINNNKDHNINILELLMLTNNNLCLFNNKIYYLQNFKETIDVLKNNKYSKEYYVYILTKNLKKNNNIFDFIDLLDMNEFHKIYKSQYNLIKYYNNKPYLPINYCFYKINDQPNKIATNILLNMITILKTFEYEIYPHFFDLENIDNYNDNIDNIDLYQFLEELIQNISKSENKSDSENKKYYLLLRVITIFKLDINNSKFIFFLLQNKNYIDRIIKLIIDKNIYQPVQLLEFLLILNKVNIFISLYDKKTAINFNNLIKYFIKYNSMISFYYVLDKYFDEIKINDILPNDFLKIYLSFIKKKDNCSEYILEYFKIIINKDANQSTLLLNEINNDTFTENIFNKFLDLILESQNYKYIKNILEINKNNKNVFLTNNALFKILDNKQEELFYYIINLFEEEDNLFEKLKDTDNNTMYHYICKNSICLGYKINNKVRNNKGFKPLDLCNISPKYYKL
jgi:hypothetical protein